MNIQYSGKVRIHQVSMWGTLFSTSKDDSLDKKQIQIIVVIVVKLIFYFQNEYKVSTVIQSIIEGLKLKSIQSFLG